MIENPEIKSQQEPQVSKDSFPSCECCAWKHKSLSGVIPCEYCIRNPEIVSKRWKGPKELSVKGIKMDVPRDMYISEEMLHFFKIIITAYSKENEMLQALLERSKIRNPPIYEPMWEVPYWSVITADNKTYQTTWVSWAMQMKKQLK